MATETTNDVPTVLLEIPPLVRQECSSGRHSNRWPVGDKMLTPKEAGRLWAANHPDDSELEMLRDDVDELAEFWREHMGMACPDGEDVTEFLKGAGENFDDGGSRKKGPTLDEVIARLEAERARVGGDARVVSLDTEAFPVAEAGDKD